MINPFFTNVTVTNFEEAQTSDTKKFATFFWAMMHNGVFLPPSQFEAWFLSSALSNKDLEKIKKSNRSRVNVSCFKNVMDMIKNDLFLRALKGETVDRPPVWMMRQAGRYLPEFMEIKKKYDFFTRCQTPELASEITVQPIRRYGMDAAILFSDILVIPQAMNIEVQMKPDFGPYLPNPIRNQKDVDSVIVPDVHEALGYVMEAIKATKEKLNNEVPLIGFAGSPWTILCYCVQGQGSKNFDKAKELCFTNPVVAHQLLQKITDTTIAYLKAKVAAGVDAVQVFDSWGGMLSPVDYQEFSWQYIQQIIDALKDDSTSNCFR